MKQALIYLEECLDEIALTGKTVIDRNGFNVLQDVYYALRAVEWRSVNEQLPEDMPGNEGKKVIPCLVAVAPPKSQPNRKPRVTVAQRQFIRSRYSPSGWEWSRSLDVIKWRPLPEV